MKSMMTPMNTISLHQNGYTKGEKLEAARDFDMTFGASSVKVDEGTVATVVSETGAPLIVKFKGVNQEIAIPMSDADKFLRKLKEDVEGDRMRRSLVLSEGLILRETRFPTRVSESAGRRVRVTTIDQSFNMRPFAHVFGDNLTTLVGKEGEIVLEYMELNGHKVFKVEFGEAGQVALQDNEFEYLTGLEAESKVRRSLRPGLAEGVEEGLNEVSFDDLNPKKNVPKQHAIAVSHGYKHENTSIEHDRDTKKSYPVYNYTHPKGHSLSLSHYAYQHQPSGSRMVSGPLSGMKQHMDRYHGSK